MTTDQPHPYNGVTTDQPHPYNGVTTDQPHPYNGVTTDQPHPYNGVTTDQPHPYIGVTTDPPHPYNRVTTDQLHPYNGVTTDQPHPYNRETRERTRLKSPPNNVIETLVVSIIFVMISLHMCCRLCWYHVIYYLYYCRVGTPVFFDYVIIQDVFFLPRVPLASRHSRLHPVLRPARPRHRLRRLHGAKVPN